MAVQQIQRFVAVEPLFVIPVINSDIERLFLVLNRKIGGAAAEPGTDGLVGLSIDD